MRCKEEKSKGQKIRTVESNLDCLAAGLGPRCALNVPLRGRGANFYEVQFAARRVHSAAFNAGEIDMPLRTAATPLSTALVGDDEIVILLLRPSLWYIPLASLGSLVIIALITFFMAYLARLSWIGWTDTQAFALGIGLAAIRLGWQLLEWWSRVYILTDRRVIRRMGVVRVIIFEAPLRNIQHTSIFATLRERIFALGTIGFATSGSDVFDAFWVMVNQPYSVHKVVTETIEKYGRK